MRAPPVAAEPLVEAAALRRHGAVEIFLVVSRKYVRIPPASLNSPKYLLALINRR
jgi:hypothetical protein